jgi:subtilisin family serine protease
VTNRETAGTAPCATSNGHGGAVVRFLPRYNHAYTARVRGRDHAMGNFHVVVLGGGLRLTNACGSVAFPADGEEVIAVGAVSASGQREAYSSFGTNASPRKPELVATVPFRSAWRERPFAGTSAAAPQAAALAALIWARHPDWTAKQVREELQRDAEQLGKKSPDVETGYGRIHLP